MMIVSVSFSQVTPTYILYNSSYYVRSYVQNEIKDYSSKLPTSSYSNYQTPSSNFPNLTIYEIDSSQDLGTMVQSGTTFYYYMRRWVVYTPKTANDCPNGTISNGQCIIPETCDPVGGKYTSSTTGQCVDCSSFSGVSGKAMCACDARGSTYSNQSVLITINYTSGQYTWKESRATCADGVQVLVYTDPVSNTPTDNNTSTPIDNNTTTPPSDTNTTTPTDGNTTTPTPSQSDVVNALKQIENGQKDATTALKDVGVDVKAMKEQMDKNSLTYADILKSINTGNEKADKMYQLTDDMYKGQTQIKNTMGKWVDDFSKSSTAQLNATVDVKTATNDVEKAVKGTTGAVNAQGDKIAGKLDDILNALKDGNGTDMSATNDLLDKIKKDTNSTASGVSKLHDDLNTTNDILGKLKGMFDNNDSYKAPDMNESKFELSDLLPDNNWFETNKLKLNFGNYSGGCYCQTAEFRVAGHTFIFPPQEALDVIPFDVISKIFMAFIYVLGLKEFLRN